MEERPLRALRRLAAAAGAHDEVAALLVELEVDQARLADVLEQVVEAGEAVVLLVEAGEDAARRLLHHRAPDRVVVALEGLHDLDHALHRLVGAALRAVLAGAGRRPLRLLGVAHEIVVVDELVAGADQEVRGRALDAAADHAAVVLLELRGERREVAVAGDQREDVDVVLLVAEVEGVDHHVDVGAVLAARLGLRDVDQLDARRVELGDRAPVLAPVAVGALEDDAPLLEQPAQHQVDLESALAHVPRADGEVLVVDEDGDQRLLGHAPPSAGPRAGAARAIVVGRDEAVSREVLGGGDLVAGGLLLRAQVALLALERRLLGLLHLALSLQDSRPALSCHRIDLGSGAPPVGGAANGPECITGTRGLPKAGGKSLHLPGSRYWSVGSWRAGRASGTPSRRALRTAAASSRARGRKRIPSSRFSTRKIAFTAKA